MRTFIFTLAVLAFTGTMALAQTVQPQPAPQPATQNAQGTKAPDISGDADKLRVQERWASQPDSAAAKSEKSAKKDDKAATPKPQANKP